MNLPQKNTKKNFPNDEVLVCDAHKFLEENYGDFDFIWSSPPCPTHSIVRLTSIGAGSAKPVYPDMTLYQEIIFLKKFATKGLKWVVENVKPYYEPLIAPSAILQRHFYWSNFIISNYVEIDNRKHNDIAGNSIVYDFDVSKSNIKDKRKALRNLVNPKLGKHILDCALKF